MIDSNDLNSCHFHCDSSAFWKEWQPRIHRTASRFAKQRWVDRDDLHQSSRIALVRAAARFDPSTGTSFTNYGLRAIRNAVYDEASVGRARSVLHSVVSNDDGETLVAKLESAEITEHLRRWVETLPVRLSSVFQLLYVRGLSQRQAARELGLGQPRVAPLHKALLVRARESLGSLNFHLN